MRTKTIRRPMFRQLLFALLLFAATLSLAVFVAPALAIHTGGCPTDTNGDGFSDNPNTLCVHLAASDGFIDMADGYPIYTFGFSNITGVPENVAMMSAMLKAEFAGPTLELKEGQDFYLSVSNIGFVIRPDLFDPHTVHFHGFVNASTFFDGEPMASFGIGPLATLTYYFKPVDPGTYMYHCHVEATEHMQMGMLGNLYVKPAQDGTPFGGYTQFAYNDGDGSTGYDVAYPIQIHAMDSNFHDLHINVQPLPFALMFDDYFMLNGRGYPDTVNPAPIPNTSSGDAYGIEVYDAQPVSSLITATAGDRILLRIANLSFKFETLTTPGIPMTIVGRDAKLLRSTDGLNNLYVTTTSVDLGGGETADVILDTAGVPPGTYFLYVANLNHLVNGEEELGGMMTEIVLQ